MRGKNLPWQVFFVLFFIFEFMVNSSFEFVKFALDFIVVNW